MANEIVPIGQQVGAISASMRQRMALASNKSFASNVTASYPMLSIKGSRFTFRLPDGTTHMHDRLSLDVILVDASDHLGKAYYAQDFDPSATEWLRPDCWSLDSIKPDPSSPALVSKDPAVKSGPTCAVCQHNVYGSKILPNGKKAFACPDHRRVVVLLPQQIGADKPMPMVLRVPRSSLKNLKGHADHMDRFGVDVRAMISRLSFVEGASFPQLLFNYVNVLDEKQYEWVLQLGQSEMVKGMISAPDFENATQSPQQETPQRNEPLKPMDVEPPIPIFDRVVDEEEDEPAVQQTVAAVQQPLQAVPSHWIELPDGLLYDPITGEYVDRPEPKVDMPANDPETLTLPDGKFFNKTTKTYVSGPQVGAPPVQAPGAPPEKKARAPRTKAKPVEPAGGSLDALNAAVQGKPEPVKPVEMKAETKSAKPAGNGNGSAVVPASVGLDELIKTTLGKTVDQ